MPPSQSWLEASNAHATFQILALSPSELFLLSKEWTGKGSVLTSQFASGWCSRTCAKVQDTDPSQHSPWELFDEGMSAEEMRAEAPSLDMSERQRLQAALKQLMQTRKYQLFCKTPGPDAVYATGDEGMAGCIHILVVMLALKAQKTFSSLMIFTDAPKLCHSCCMLGEKGDHKA